MDTIRSFIAIELPPEIQRKLDAVSAQLKKTALKGLRWVPGNNIHLTLKFLGDIPSSAVSKLSDSLEAEALRLAAFEIQIGQIGAFPNRRNPRVIWVGVQAPPELMQLQKGIDFATAALGYPSEDRPFFPHLTLGRVSRMALPEDVRLLSELLTKAQVGQLGSAKVKSVHLFKSDLKPEGAVYSSIYQAKLSSLASS